MDVPPLYLVGTPGYLGTALEAELASMPANVRILSGVSDGGVAELLQHAVALLHPSRAEGFGYPPLEASAFGCPLILSDLPVFRETVGDNPVYVNPDDLYGWTKAVHAVLSRHGQRKRGEQSAGIRLPTWVAHLNHVLSMVWEEHDGENGAGARRGHG